MKFSGGSREGGYVPFGPFLAGAGFTGDVVRAVLHGLVRGQHGAAYCFDGVGLAAARALAQLRSRHGAAVLDADAISRQLTAVGGAAIPAITSTGARCHRR
jgi:hypothetical protein